MTNTKNPVKNLDVREPATRPRRKYKLTKKGKKFVLTAAAITALISMGIMTMKKINDNKAFEQPMSAIVETVKDETVFDDIAMLNGINFEEIDQIYANASTYGSLSQNDIAKVENLGINAIKASVMDAYGLDVKEDDEVKIMPSNVGNNRVNINNKEDGQYCVIKVGDQTIRVNQYDSFLKENAVYDLAQDVYLIQSHNFTNENGIVNLNNDEVKQIEELIDTSKEVITSNYKLKNTFFGETELKTVNRR